jgi:hypothetical protein
MTMYTPHSLRWGSTNEKLDADGAKQLERVNNHIRLNTRMAKPPTYQGPKRNQTKIMTKNMKAIRRTMKTRMPVDAVDVVFRTIWPDLRDHGSWIYGCTLMLSFVFGRPGQENKRFKINKFFKFRKF